MIIVIYSCFPFPFSVNGDEAARKKLWDDLLDRAIVDLGLMNGLEAELEASGLAKVQDRLEDLDREFFTRLHFSDFLKNSITNHSALIQVSFFRNE